MNWEILPHTDARDQGYLYLTGASSANPPPSLAQRDLHFVLRAQSRHQHTVFLFPLFLVRATGSIPPSPTVDHLLCQWSLFKHRIRVCKRPRVSCHDIGEQSKSLKEIQELCQHHPWLCEVRLHSTSYILHPPSLCYCSTHEKVHSPQMESA